MDKSTIRGIDIIASLLFFIFGIIILVSAFQMPMTESYAGVQNIFYTSPALFPIVIGVGMCLLAIAIFRHAIKQGGISQLKQLLKKRKQTHIFDEKGIRFASILVPLITLVYVNITRIDFYFTVTLFLLFTVSVFYVDSLQIMRKMLVLFSIAMGFILIFAVTRLDKMITSSFYYFMDCIALVILIIMTIALIGYVKKYAPDQKKKLRKIFYVSYITPLVIIVAFKFFLRIPMPKEGAIVDLLAMVYYTLR